MTPGSRTVTVASQTGSVSPVIVDDPLDPRLDEVRHLRSPDRVLRRAGLVVVEGFTIVERLLATGHDLRRLVVTPTMWARLQPTVSGPPHSVVVVAPDTLAAAAGFDVHRGVLAFVDEPPMLTVDQLAVTARTVVVVEGLNDAENLGALMRSAWALGADALLLDPTTLDPFGRRVVRVSMGAALHLPVARAAIWPDDLARLRAEGYTVLALTPATEATALVDVRVPPQQRLAVVLGAEGPGLSQAAQQQVDVAVRIPMRPGVDSLNVAHAGAIALAHFGRAPTITP
jgi:tRNA G18 (ribose-2'-O)-methylase SpoU